MKYGIKTHGLWNAPYWKDAEDKKKNIFHKSEESYCDLDEKSFKEILNDELDVPDYAITPKNISREFGYTGTGFKIDDACMIRIVEYYKFRKSLYKKICDLLFSKEMTKTVKRFGAAEFMLRYDIPAEYNSFDCDDPNYDAGQIEAWIEISVFP